MPFKDVNQQQTNELEVWRQFRAGDYQSFALLYQEYGKLLLTYGCRLTPDEDLVKDCIQDFFVELWHRRQTLPEEINSLKFYFLGAIKYKIFRAKNQQERKEGWQADLENGLPELPFENLLIESEDKAEQILRLQNAIARLAPRQQEVIHLRFFQNLSPTETAQLMKLEAQSVRNLLHVALRGLRKQLDSYPQAIIFLFTGFY